MYENLKDHEKEKNYKKAEIKAFDIDSALASQLTNS
jgi:hypothetical protein